MKAFQLFLAVLVLGAANAHSTNWHEGVLFANVQTADIASAKSKIKVSGDYQAPELRQICLREVKDNNCEYYGCRSITDCTNAQCSGCATEYSYQTELACCKDKDDYSEAAAGGVPAPSIKVGTCDWTFDFYQCDPGTYGSDCPELGGFVAGKYNAVKYGTAWATCYFNSDSESCGHPFCDKMVMSFQGGLYSMPVYVDIDSFEMPNNDNSCKGKGNTAKHIKGQQEAPQKKTTRREGGDPLYQSGTATVVSGPVTVTSLNHHMEYNRGILEWISAFNPNESDPVSTRPTDLRQVVPYTLNVVLASSGGSDDSYQPRVDKGAYGNEGYNN